jgi:hypothetical protein
MRKILLKELSAKSPQKIAIIFQNLVPNAKGKKISCQQSLKNCINGKKLCNNTKFSPLASKRTQRKHLKMSKLPITQYLKKY